MLNKFRTNASFRAEILNATLAKRAKAAFALRGGQIEVELAHNKSSENVARYNKYNRLLERFIRRISPATLTVISNGEYPIIERDPLFPNYTPKPTPTITHHIYPSPIEAHNERVARRRAFNERQKLTKWNTYRKVG